MREDVAHHVSRFTLHEIIMSDKSFVLVTRDRLITGLVAVLPAVLTIWVLWWVVRFVDGLFQPLFLQLFGRTLPGIGLILVPILLYLIGWLVQNRISKRLIEIGENIVNRLPIVGALYSAVKQTLDVFNVTSAEQKFSRVAFVEYPREGVWTLGFVTRELDFRGERSVALFMPTTPNPTSGVLIVVPEKDTLPTSMTMEEAAKFVISGGILVPGERPLVEGDVIQTKVQG
jgi:uncharacterized membrane protein